MVLFTKSGRSKSLHIIRLYCIQISQSLFFSFFFLYSGNVFFCSSRAERSSWVTNGYSLAENLSLCVVQFEKRRQNYKWVLPLKADSITAGSKRETFSLKDDWSGLCSSVLERGTGTFSPAGVLINDSDLWPHYQKEKAEFSQWDTKVEINSHESPVRAELLQVDSSVHWWNGREEEVRLLYTAFRHNMVTLFFN